MRVQSCSLAKEINCGRGRTRKIPTDGTELRRMYNFLERRRGIPINVSLTCLFYNGDARKSLTAINQLRDYYGLDIRKIARGRWVLAGEWFNSTYQDYIADKLAARSSER